MERGVSRGVLSSASDDDGGGFKSAMREQPTNHAARIMTVTHVRNGRQVSARAINSALLSS